MAVVRNALRPTVPMPTRQGFFDFFERERAIWQRWREIVSSRPSRPRRDPRPDERRSFAPRRVIPDRTRPDHRSLPLARRTRSGRLVSSLAQVSKTRRDRSADRPADTVVVDSDPRRARIARAARLRLGAWGSRIAALLASGLIHIFVLLSAVAILGPFGKGPPRAEESTVIEIRLIDLQAPAPARKSEAAPPKPEAPTPSPPVVLEANPLEAENPATEPGASGGGDAGESASAEPAPLVISRSTLPGPELPGRGRERSKSPGAGPGGPGIGSRSKGKADALRRYGGSELTENAVAAGLAWLALHQNGDGSWTADGFSRHCGNEAPCGGPGLDDFDIAVTALATLAFLGAGHEPERPGPYRQNVRRALDWLVSRQESNGAFGPEESGFFYDQSGATLALGEAWGATRSRVWGEAALSALGFIERAQQPGGGWDYFSDKTENRNDLSITGWVVLVYHAAKLARLAELPQTVEERLRGFLGRSFLLPGRGVYADRGLGAGRQTVNMTAVALLAHDYTGGDPAHPICVRAIREIVGSPPNSKAIDDWERTHQSYYYWYVATLCLFHYGGRHWDEWNLALQRVVLPLQESEGHARGSWRPEGSWIGASGGRVYATAMNVLTLEVYYRYPPLFANRKK
jgi:hypothetical protein